MNEMIKENKTYQRLVKKANLGICETSRMPNLNKVGELLTELGIENHVQTWSCEKWSSAAGCRYYTSGGTREYNGYRLMIPNHMVINSTDTYYSWNNQHYAQQLVELIENNI